MQHHPPISVIPTGSRVVALTFDDGPKPGVTEMVLDLLDHHRAKATFFVIGERVERHPSVVKEIVARGHELAIHTYDHERAAEKTHHELVDDMRRCSSIIFDVSGRLPRMYRPPFGDISPQMIGACDMMGLRLVGWSASSRDWVAMHRVSTIVSWIRMQSFPGSILLFHDGHRLRRPVATDTTLRLLDGVLPSLAERGIAMRSVERSLEAWDESRVRVAGPLRILGSRMSYNRSGCRSVNLNISMFFEFDGAFGREDPYEILVYNDGTIAGRSSLRHLRAPHMRLWKDSASIELDARRFQGLFDVDIHCAGRVASVGSFMVDRSKVVLAGRRREHPLWE